MSAAVGRGAAIRSGRWFVDLWLGYLNGNQS
jgi:hypothetical protein